MTADFLLQADELGCERGERLLFEALSFTVRPGEAWLVEGANGSGKTTLLRMLCGLRRPDAGDVLWNGTAIETVRPAFNAAVAYLGHASGIKLELTADENLRFAGALSGGHGERDAALARVELDPQEDQPAASFSAGQKRRLAMARLLLSRARVWILDEPFTALDPAGRTLVRDLLAEQVAGGGAAIMATHHDIAIEGATVHRLRIGDGGS